MSKITTTHITVFYDGAVTRLATAMDHEGRELVATIDGEAIEKLTLEDANVIGKAVSTIASTILRAAGVS